MRIKGLVIVICAVVLVLAVRNNSQYARTNQEAERVEQEKDSICLMQYESLLYAIQANGQMIDSLVQVHNSADSAFLKNQEHLLQKMELLIHLNKQMLEQDKKQRCSISSTIHTAE